MLATYLLPVKTAVSVFPIIALLVMLPAAIVSYRHRGRAGGWAALVFYSFLFYLLAASLQTVVPLPADPAGYCAVRTYASDPQLRPFQFVESLARPDGRPWSLNAMLHDGSFWTVALNVVLLLPLGGYLRYAKKVRLLPAAVLGFGASLFLELTQLTGLWFIYPCAYRLFSVDDLILNTAGAVLGWLIAGPVGRLLPTLEPERDRRRYATKVTASRRFFALLVDGLGFMTVTGIALGLIHLVGGSATDLLLLVVAVVAVGWFVVVPLLTSGSTIGKRAMLLRVVCDDGRRAGPLALLVRNGVLLSPLWLLWLALAVDDWDVFARPAQLLIPLGMLASLVVVGIWTPLAVLFGGEEAPYERLSRTRNEAIVITEEQPTEPVPEQSFEDNPSR